MKVLLINLGGPRSSNEIERFLTDLFTDPYVFDLPLPEFIRFRLAKFIARKRAPKVAKAYEAMGFGGGSPLFGETEKQARALESYLKKETGKDWKVKVAMTCGFPALRELPAEELIPSPENIIFPLFPHFSRSTVMSTTKIIESRTGSCPANSTSGPCGDLCGNEIKNKNCPFTQKGFIAPFHSNPNYIEATVNLILDYFNGKLKPDDFLHLEPINGIDDWQNTALLFSAHGIPLRLIKKGDTYRSEIEENVKNLTNLLRQKGFMGQTFLSFQSRVGPAKWTEPNTIDMLKELGRNRFKKVAVYPISFVSDHLETLEEIGQQLKEVAIQSGIEYYYRIPAHGIYHRFIEAIGKLIIKESKL